MTRKNLLAFMIIITLIIISSGCAQNPDQKDITETAKTECISMCYQQLEKGTDLSDGPCLSDPGVIANDWVCDVAHSPRQPIDNQQENQCKAFREGRARHFVEVDENCNIITVY